MKNSFRNTIRVSYSLDPDQARHFVGPDLGPNCLQRLSGSKLFARLSADDTSSQRDNSNTWQLPQASSYQIFRNPSCLPNDLDVFF